MMKIRWCCSLGCLSETPERGSSKRRKATNDAASVLIVDDEPSIRLMFHTVLQSAGYDAVEAGDGPSALARLHESSPDVVLLDLKMPGMDGMETLRQMRDRGDDTTVVIVTAHGSIADAVAAMKLGAVDFLTKPVTPDGLRRVVREVILRHGQPEPPSRPTRVPEPLPRPKPVARISARPGSRFSRGPHPDGRAP